MDRLFHLYPELVSEDRGNQNPIEINYSRHFSASKRDLFTSEVLEIWTYDVGKRTHFQVHSILVLSAAEQ